MNLDRVPSGAAVPDDFIEALQNAPQRAPQHMLNPGDEVLVPSPDYPLWTASVVIHGATAVHYPCRPERGFVPDPAEVEVHAVGQGEQTHRIGDVTAALTNDFGQIRLRIGIFIRQLFVAERFFNRIEIGALNVFNDRDFKRFLVAGLDDKDRNVMKRRTLRGQPPAFTGDDFIDIVHAGDRPDEDRLDNALFAD